jgi:hypothetical protein
LETLNARDQLDKAGVMERIILKWLSKIYGVRM